MLMSEIEIKKLSKIDLVREAKIVANVFFASLEKITLKAARPL